LPLRFSRALGLLLPSSDVMLRERASSLGPVKGDRRDLEGIVTLTIIDAD
jgi:hypothetical protein